MSQLALERIFRLLRAMAVVESHGLRRRTKGQTRSVLFPMKVATALLALSTALAVGAKLGAPKWFVPACLLAAFLCYLAIFAVVASMARTEWAESEPLRRHHRNPLHAFLRNAGYAARLDAIYFPRLGAQPTEALKLALFEVRATKEFLERRMALTVGPFEKVGLLPGILALAYSVYKALPTGNLTNFLRSNLAAIADRLHDLTSEPALSPLISVALAAAGLYLLGIRTLFQMTLIERYIKQLELVLAQAQGAASSSPSSSPAAELSPHLAELQRQLLSGARSAVGRGDGRGLPSVLRPS